MADWHNSSVVTPSSPGEEDEGDEIPFTSRRSPLYCRNGCVASSQPLASSIALQILVSGGNAADAAVACAAALAVTEPCSTGLGGDMFALYYDANDSNVKGTNGSGRCPGALTLDLLRQKYPDGKGNVNLDLFRKSVDAVTVPCAAAGWEAFYKRHGSGTMTFGELLEPAAKLAEEGFPVAPLTSQNWSDGVKSDIQKWIKPNEKVPLTVDGVNGPKPGQIIKNPELARVLRSLGAHGARKGFYESFPGQAIVNAIQKHGGVMTMDDLSEDLTECTFPDSIFVEYKGLKVHQIPPNGQGIAGLIALCGFDALEASGVIPKPERESGNRGWKDTQTYHALLEMMRLGFADARSYVCDEDFCKQQGRHIKTAEYLLDKDRIKDRALRTFNKNEAVVQGMPDPTSCTVSFQVIDREGNAVSFVNSNFMGFGTGIVPDGCGFTLQNRGYGFNMDDEHPNALMPYKRPYHTIIPAMITHVDTDELYATISNMGGFMQPQGHLQLVIALANEMDPQEAIDQPRFCIRDGTYDGNAWIEEGIKQEILNELHKKGHNISPNKKGYARFAFGKAQIIVRDRKTGVLCAGSEGRSDGCAMGF